MVVKYPDHIVLSDSIAETLFIPAITHQEIMLHHIHPVHDIYDFAVKYISGFIMRIAGFVRG